MFDNKFHDPIDRSNVMEQHAQRAFDAFKQFSDGARAVFDDPVGEPQMASTT